MGRCKTIVCCLHEDEDPKLEMDKTSNLYRELKDYHYGEMLKRLENAGVDGKLGDCGKEIGSLLRILWHKFQSNLTVKSTKINGAMHEQDMKKKYNEVTNNSRFENNGIYIDLLHDTYQKDWSKAYQNTFHEFYHAIDWFAGLLGSKCCSRSYHDMCFEFVAPDWITIRGFAAGKKCIFGEVIKKDIENLKKYGRLGEIHALPKHDKAPLYDAIGGVLYKGKYPDKYEDEELFPEGKNQDYEQHGHYPVSWLRDGFKNEAKTHYISKEKAAEYLRKLKQVAEKYEIKEKHKNEYYKELKEDEKYINKHFPAGDVAGDEPDEEKKAALAKFAKIAAFAIRAGGGDDPQTVGIVENVQKHFPVRLAMEVFAHMASTAMVNPKAFEEMKKYLPNTHNMFVDILESIVCGVRFCVN